MRRFRWWLSRRKQQTYARVRGYFWIPCPRCGTPFGGHEWRTNHDIPKDDGSGQSRCICPPCAYEIGSKFDGICRDVGHDYNEVWKATTDPVKRVGNKMSQTMSFDLEMPPSHVLCDRCYMEFDPLTRLPIGRPLW